MRKVERLVNLVALLLDTHRPLTLDQVAELVPGYEATGESLRRMFERDKEELRGLGVPVERGPIDPWGSEEGYFIDPNAYAMPRLDLAPDERAALALAARAWSGAAGDPSALVHRRGTWYVAGHDSGRGALRSFRLSRIQSAVRMAKPSGRGPEFEVPDWFDASDVLPTAGEPDASPIATVRAGRAAARLAELRGAKPDGEEGPDGRVTLRMPIVDREGFVDWAIGNGIEVVEPEELRTQARRRLEGLLALLEGGRK